MKKYFYSTEKIKMRGFVDKVNKMKKIRDPIHSIHKKNIFNEKSKKKSKQSNKVMTKKQDT